MIYFDTLNIYMLISFQVLDLVMKRSVNSEQWLVQISTVMWWRDRERWMNTGKSAHTTHVLMKLKVSILHLIILNKD